VTVGVHEHADVPPWDVDSRIAALSLSAVVVGRSASFTPGGVATTAHLCLDTAVEPVEGRGPCGSETE
jgi:hypothetical protein